ncbi:MAG: EpsG family protein [Eubacterium sp.]
MFGLSAVECFICIIAIYIVVYWITPRKAAWLPFALVVVLLSVLAYNVTPNFPDDLSRYFMQLDYLREYGYDYLKRCFEDNANGNNWGTYRMCGYYFYFLSKFPDNHWMPTVTIFITYGLMFLIIYKAANHFGINKLYLFGATMILLSTYWYYDTYSGIRNGLTFAVIIACAYYHLVERKRIIFCYLGYILASLMHSAGIMMVALVILAVITLNNSGKFMNFLLVFGLVAGGALMQYLAGKTNNSFIQSVAGQAERHQAGETMELGTMFLVNISMFVFVTFIVMYFSSYILNSEYANDFKRFYKYSSIVLYFMVGCLYSGLIFVRIARWILPVIASLFFMIGSQMQSNYIEDKGISYCRYYSSPNEQMRIKIKPVMNIAVIVYVAVHFWYLCAGSSLYWMHF